MRATRVEIINHVVHVCSVQTQKDISLPKCAFPGTHAQLRFALLSIIREHSTVNLNPLDSHTHRDTHTRARACTDTHIHLITFCLLKSMKLWKVFSRGMLLQSPQYLSNKRAFPEQTALGVECGSTVPSGGLRASFMLRLLSLKRSKTYCLQIILKLPQSLGRHGNN